MKSFDDWANELADTIREKRKDKPSPSQEEARDPLDGVEEGSPCLIAGCQGVHEIGYGLDGGCSCFKSPPCAYCQSTYYVCAECGYEPFGRP